MSTLTEQAPPVSAEYLRTPMYEYNGETLRIDDPVWGKETIGDQDGDEVLLELLHNPLVRRAMAIEQLTLDEDTATIPGTTNFSRWEHVWGSVVFVRKMTKDLDMDPRERMVLQLRTFVSDLAHTAYSHQGDWIFQGAGGPENQHDVDLMRILEVSGVNDTLRRHGFDPYEAVFPAIYDWVECDSPELCVDRVDYGVREILRWLGSAESVRRAANEGAFSLRDGKIVMADIEVARSFAKAFLLLSTEHWSEPVHRLQLHLHGLLVKSVVGGDYTNLTALDTAAVSKNYHPRELLYTVDGDITRQSHLSGPFQTELNRLMAEIGARKRELFTKHRLGQLALFLDADTPDFPDPLLPYGSSGSEQGPPVVPDHISIIPVETVADCADFETNPEYLDFLLPALKPRQIDPLFVAADGSVQRLSEADSNFQALRQTQAKLMQRAYVARIRVGESTKVLIEQGVAETDAQWLKALQRGHMPDKVLRGILENSVAIAAMHSMVKMQWRA